MASGIAHDFATTRSRRIVGLRRAAHAERPTCRARRPRPTRSSSTPRPSTPPRSSVALRELYRDRTRGRQSATRCDLRRCIEEVVALDRGRAGRTRPSAQGIADPHRDAHRRRTALLGRCRGHPRDAGQSHLQRGRRDAERAARSRCACVHGRAPRCGSRSATPARACRTRSGSTASSRSSRRRASTAPVLGLSLVHSTVQRHDGTLAIESVPGRGTTFIVRLPAP